MMIGPPGTGKTLLAKRLPTILPPLTPAESLEASAADSHYSPSGSGPQGTLRLAPIDTVEFSNQDA